MRVVARVCSCLARSLWALYIDLRCQSDVGVCSGERVVDMLVVGGGSIVFDRIATTFHRRVFYIHVNIYEQFVCQSRCFLLFCV